MGSKRHNLEVSKICHPQKNLNNVNQKGIERQPSKIYYYNIIDLHFRYYVEEEEEKYATA